MEFTAKQIAEQVQRMILSVTMYLSVLSTMVNKPKC